jgi:hypothetical protein
MSLSLYFISRIVNRIGLCLLALAAFSAASAVEAGQALAEEAEAQGGVVEGKDRITLSESLDILSGDDAASRRWVAEDACHKFEALQSSPYGGEALSQIVEALRRYLRHEEDDWIASRLIENIGCHDFHLLQAFFLDALASPSPNLRWRVFQLLRWVDEPEAVPLLEEAWPGESRPWARVDLIRALAWNHSTRYLEEFRNLAEGDDPDLSSAAIGAIILLDDQSALPLLARLAREGTKYQRMEAADALSLMPESPVSLSALLDATDDEDPSTRQCAVRSLGKRGDPVALARVLAVSFTDPDEDVRKAGLESLYGSSWQAFLPKIVKAIPDESLADRDVIENQILRVVGHLPSGASQPNVTLPRKPRQDGRNQGCKYWSHEIPPSMRVSPPPGRAFARCFQYPGDPHPLLPVPRGTLLSVSDHFEGLDGSWLKIDGLEVPRDCWLPAAQVVDASLEGPPDAEEGILQKEFDLQVEELEDPYFIELRQANMVKVIESEDQGDQLVTVSLRIRLGALEDEDLILQSALSSGVTSNTVFWAVMKADTRLCGYPAIEAFVAERMGHVPACPDASSSVKGSNKSE